MKIDDNKTARFILHHLVYFGLLEIRNLSRTKEEDGFRKIAKLSNLLHKLPIQMAIESLDMEGQMDAMDILSGIRSEFAKKGAEAWLDSQVETALRKLSRM